MSSILHPNKVPEPGQLWHLRRLLSLAGAEVIVQGGEFHHTWNSNPLGGASEEPDFRSEASGSRSSLAFFRLSSSNTSSMRASTPRTAKKKKIDKRASRSVPKPRTRNPKPGTQTYIQTLTTIISALVPRLDEFSFIVVSPDKTVEFHCEDQFERNTWVSAIQDAIVKLARTTGGSTVGAQVGTTKIKQRPPSLMRGGILIPRVTYTHP